MLRPCRRPRGTIYLTCVPPMKARRNTAECVRTDMSPPGAAMRWAQGQRVGLHCIAGQRHAPWDNDPELLLGHKEWWVTGMRSARRPWMPLKVEHSLSERREPERTLDREAGSHPVDAAQARCCPGVAEVSERAVRTLQSTRAGTSMPWSARRACRRTSRQPSKACSSRDWPSPPASVRDAGRRSADAVRPGPACKGGRMYQDE